MESINTMEADKHFIKNPKHPRLLSIANAMKVAPLGAHSWLFYMEDIEGERHRWYEVLEINMEIDESGFTGHEEDALHEIWTRYSRRLHCPPAATTLTRYTSPAPGSRNSSYTVRLHRECGFKDQTHRDYLSYTWERQ